MRSIHSPRDQLRLFGRIAPGLDQQTIEYLESLYKRALDVSDHLKQLSENPSKVALLIIDVQKEYCSQKYKGNPKTEQIAGDIARLVPCFRQAGIGVYAIYFEPHAMLKRPDEYHLADFYKFKPVPETDHVIGKIECNAFSSERLVHTLKREGHEHVLLCGFYLSACVAATMNGALESCQSVTLLNDLTCDGGNPRPGTQSLEESFRKVYYSLQERCGYACPSREVLNAFTSPEPS